MDPYADPSFLVGVYSPEPDSVKALQWLQRHREPLPFTPFHRHEVRNAIRLRVFRGDITPEQRKRAFEEIEEDLTDGILVHTTVPWTNAFRESEDLAAAHNETLGVRSIDLLHVGLALSLKTKEFLTFDTRQAKLAKAAGLRVMP